MSDAGAVRKTIRIDVPEAVQAAFPVAESRRPWLFCPPFDYATGQLAVSGGQFAACARGEFFAA
jgi:hypothetical protein